MSGWPQLFGKIFGLAFAIYITLAVAHWFRPHVVAGEWGIVALTFGAVILLNYVLADRDERQEFRADSRRLALAAVLGLQGFARRMRAYWRPE